MYGPPDGETLALWELITVAIYGHVPAWELLERPDWYEAYRDHKIQQDKLDDRR